VRVRICWGEEGSSDGASFSFEVEVGWGSGPDDAFLAELGIVG